MITISCALIGHIRNDVNDLIGAKTTKGNECCLNVRSRVWGGALRDETQNGCDSLRGRGGRPFESQLFMMARMATIVRVTCTMWSWHVVISVTS